MSLRSLDELLETLRAGAGADDGEPVDLLTHMLQCATVLAEVAPDDEELQLAGLVHDVGTVLAPDRSATHAATGAAAVAPLLGPRVAALVAGHDQAKRYLVSIDPAYRARLSATSTVSLAPQGGAMDAAERARFERSEHFGSLVALRHADDAAKTPGRPVPGLGEWREQLARASRGRW